MESKRPASLTGGGPISAQQVKACWSWSASPWLESEKRPAAQRQEASGRTTWTAPHTFSWETGTGRVAATLVSAALSKSALTVQLRYCGICLIYFWRREAATTYRCCPGMNNEGDQGECLGIFSYMCLLFTHLEHYWNNCSRCLPGCPAFTFSILETLSPKSKSVRVRPCSSYWCPKSLIWCYRMPLGWYWNGTLHCSHCFS